MNKRVYGILGISSIMSNWNADFTGYPKTISTGEIFGSDKALKYPIKKMWDNEGQKVLYIKSMKLSKGKSEVVLVPRSLKERYEYLFEEEDLKKCKDSGKVLSNLFSCIDVKNFGATFAEEGNNISITGAVQIGQGFNKYDESYAEEQQILSPFRDPTEKSNKKSKNQEEGEEAKNSTLGSKIVSNEAHYVYTFVINPLAYKEFEELGVTDGYTENDYNKFKNAALCAATSFSTNAKVGCENEFALFVETESNTYLPTLSEYVTFEKGEEKNIIKLNCGDLINSLGDRIISVELYYNPYKTEILTDIKGVKNFNIFTKQEV